jgi:hypothetical protein
MKAPHAPRHQDLTSIPTRVSPSVDARVLLLAADEADPTTQAWVRQLRRLGGLFDLLLPSALQPLLVSDLVDESGHGRYNAIIMTTDSSQFLASMDVLMRYRRAFSVRQLAAFEYPRPQVGLDDPLGQDLSGSLPQLTEAGRLVFPYLRGSVPIDHGTFGYLSDSVDRACFTALLSLADRPLVGLTTGADGTEEMVVTVNYADTLIHWRLLARGLLTWVTRGVHLGMGHHLLSCHVDDVFLSSAPPAFDEATEPISVRMTAEDVEALVQWQTQHDMTLDLAFNGAGAALSGDGLTDALLRHKEQFRWLNHTWGHLDLDGRATEDRGAVCWPDADSICQQIERNRQWADRLGVRASATALVTGGHSGLSNPHLPAALVRCGISVIATDASREPSKAHIGAATAVPRHPTNISTHVTTCNEMLEDYNDRYSPVSDCTQLIDLEARIILRHMLSHDPRPTFGHQANITGERPLLAVLERTLDLYREYVSEEAPVLNLSMDAIAQELDRRAEWRRVSDQGGVTASIRSGGLQLSSDVDVDVPLTLPLGSSAGRSLLRRVPFGDTYGSSACGWQRLRSGTTLRISLPSRDIAQ